MPVSAVISSKKPCTDSVSTSGKRWRPRRATASARIVTAFSSWTIEPCPGASAPGSRIHAIDFSAVITG